MSGSVLYIEKPCKISLNNNYIIVQAEEESKKFYLPDISTVVFSSLQTSITVCLLEKLSESGKTVIFCNSKHTPYSGVYPLYGVQNAYSKLGEQILWQDEILGSIWQRIVRDKIAAQREVLSIHGKKLCFAEQVLPHDETNAEGRFADKYFHALFGRKFVRHLSDNVNIALNYGYSIILSSMSRIVAGHGYVPFIGVHHKSKTNNFNLACDCMEPFRAIVDNIVAKQNGRALDKEYKLLLLECLNKRVMYNNKSYSAQDAMELYFLDIAKSLSNNKMDIGALSVL